MHRVGCSGWQYKHWAEEFYPDDIPKSRWFQHYSGTFNTVELNATFYRLHSHETFEKWGRQAPPGFMYAVKGSRYITHNKRLKGVKEAMGKFSSRARRMGEALGVVLWQLPASLTKDIERLEYFLGTLPEGFRHAIEFRHPSWWDEETYAAMRKRNAALVIVSAPELPSDIVETADFSYVRMHGAKDWYRYDYSEAELQEWAGRIRAMRARDVFVYFNNDMDAHAPDNAKRLAELLDLRVPFSTEQLEAAEA